MCRQEDNMIKNNIKRLCYIIVSITFLGFLSKVEVSDKKTIPKIDRGSVKYEFNRSIYQGEYSQSFINPIFETEYTIDRNKSAK